jgi:hypothetical protein
MWKAYFVEQNSVFEVAISPNLVYTNAYSMPPPYALCIMHYVAHFPASHVGSHPKLMQYDIYAL